MNSIDRCFWLVRDTGLDLMKNAQYKLASARSLIVF